MAALPAESMRPDDVEVLCQRIAGADAGARLETLLALPDLLGADKHKADTELHRQCRTMFCRAEI